MEDIHEPNINITKNKIIGYMDDDLDDNIKPKIPASKTAVPASKTAVASAISKTELPKTSTASYNKPLRNERIIPPLQDMQFPNQKLSIDNMLAGVYIDGILVEEVNNEFESEPIEENNNDEKG